MANANLIVNIEMCGKGMGSTTSAHIFERSYTPLNTADYDGTCTYYCEIVATNVNASTAYSVDLIDVTHDPTGAAPEATFSIPANTTAHTRYRSAAWTPEGTSDAVYKIRVPSTAVNYDVTVWEARIVIVQVGATKTRIQIPLLNAIYDEASYNVAGHVDLTTSTSYTQGSVTYWNRWLRDDAAWGTISSYDFAAVLTPETAGTTAYAILTNLTDGTDVTGTEVSHTGATTTLYKTVNFAGNATNFHDGDQYYARIKSSGTTNNYCTAAYLYLNISDASKGEVYWRAAQRFNATAAADFTQLRTKVDTSGYSSPVLYCESTCNESTSGESSKVMLYQDGTDDSGTAGASVVTGSTITPGTTLARIRTNSFTAPTDGDRIFGHKDSTTYTLTIASILLVVAWSAGTPPTLSTTAITSITSSTASSGGTITSDGGSALTDYGVCWNTTGTPTIADSHTHDKP